VLFARNGDATIAGIPAIESLRTRRTDAEPRCAIDHEPIARPIVRFVDAGGHIVAAAFNAMGETLGDGSSSHLKSISPIASLMV
jgi:hypothetical protein